MTTIRIEEDSFGLEAVVCIYTDERLMTGLSEGQGRIWAAAQGYNIVSSR